MAVGKSLLRHIGSLAGPDMQEHIHPHAVRSPSFGNGKELQPWQNVGRRTNPGISSAGMRTGQNHYFNLALVQKREIQMKWHRERRGAWASRSGPRLAALCS